MLHIGAHRTGTTSLQKFLKKNQANLLGNDIQCIVPPDTRDGHLNSTNLSASRVIISEENMLGTMEANYFSASMYPKVSEKLNRYDKLISKDALIFLSVRNYVDWWSSLLAFTIKNGLGVPKPERISEIANLSRNWVDVVHGLRSFAKNSEIVVRDFSWKTENPKQQLRQVTGWKEFDDLPAERSYHNVSPNINSLIAALVERERHEDIIQLPKTAYYQPFASKEVERLDQKYLEDLEEISAIRGVKLLCDISRTQDTIEKRRKKSIVGAVTESPEPSGKTCFIHIGKTGGTFLKSLAATPGSENRKIFMGSHGDTLLTTIEKFGRDRKVAFFFRNPADRFVSGFLSRLRQGRPTYNVNWTNGEAIAFSYFDHPNKLAEALFSDSEREKSAARYAFSQIFHLKQNYAHYLISRNFLEHEFRSGNIVVCCETHKLDDKIDKVLEILGVENVSSVGGSKNRNPEEVHTELSKKANLNLKKFWSTEYEIYETCKEVAEKTGF